MNIILPLEVYGYNSQTVLKEILRISVQECVLGHPHGYLCAMSEVMNLIEDYLSDYDDEEIQEEILNMYAELND